MPCRIAIAAMLITTPALAQWVSQKKEDPFDKKHLYIAFTANNGYGFGVRCVANSSEMEVLFITPERAEGDGLKSFNSIKPNILVIIDEDEVVELDATFSTGDDGKIIAISSDKKSKDLALRLATARTRVAVAVSILGEKMHKTLFRAENSKKAVSTVLAECG